MSSEWQEVLIEEVRNRPCLWDKESANYKDSRTIKHNNWLDVAKFMNEKTGQLWEGK